MVFKSLDLTRKIFSVNQITLTGWLENIYDIDMVTDCGETIWAEC